MNSQAYSDQLLAKLRKAYESDGNATFFVSFESWCKIRSIAHLIIATHEEE